MNRENVEKFIVLPSGWAVLALGIAALVHWMSPSFPAWGAGLLGITSAPFIMLCVTVLVEYSTYMFDYFGFDSSEYSAHRKRLLSGWVMLAFSLAALMHWLSPWFPSWVAAGLFGIVAAPIICPLALLLPEPLPSRLRLNVKDYQDRTPLLLAAENGDLRRVKALIAKGADVNARGLLGSTALMYVAKRGSEDCVQALIAAGADVNAQEHRNGLRTALMYAAESSSAGCVRALVAAGADVKAKNRIGKTALDEARYNSGIAAILQAAEEQIAQNRRGKDAPRQTISPSELHERTSGMKPVDLTILARSTTKRSTIIVDGTAKWRKVGIKGWRYVVGQESPGAVLLTPSGPSNPVSTPGFELPDGAAGGMSLEIRVDELVWVCANDDRLVVVSPEAGAVRMIEIHCLPGSQAALAKSFKLRSM